MKPLTLTVMLGATALLAACGEKAETNVAANAGATAEATGNVSGDMGNMAMSGDTAARTAKGTGTIIEIDKAAGTVTLDHGPIPEANWPAMTMPFAVKPELLDGLKGGDKVAFDLAIKDGGGAITAIKKQ
ncbi:copper-binding protein [Sphingomonas sp. KC8]|uniref:copper-binding protein n=1 Tax=Sphingomonas sp. KC8 TaxID=1030157 RepID=UPI000495FE7B|nr:copper-binding protein [Sphingomonas sp. KC8]ARS26956.1 copper-binding protein [Sphingomonas sp. KC8]